MKKRLLAFCTVLLLAGCNSSKAVVTETSIADNTLKTTESTYTETSALETEKAATTAENTNGEEAATDSSSAVYTDTEYNLTEDNVKYLGRTFYSNRTLWMAYSASGCEFTVNGRAASMMLYGDSRANGNTDEKTKNASGDKARYAIYVDDELIVNDVMCEGARSVELFKGDEEREAKVRFVKLSATASSCIGIRSITVTDGSIKPADNKDRYIEFIGDSITCGYGVDDENKEHHYTTSTEDATKTYAYKTAAALDADYSLVSISGYGIISGYTSDGTKHSEQILEKYYDKLGFSYGKAGGFDVSTLEWDFSRKADAVILNLGTNDNSYVKGDKDRRDEFVEGYIGFLEHIREKNPESVIIAAFGIMGDELYPDIERAVAAYTEKTGDANIYTYHFDPIDDATEGRAADWHPTEKTNERCAKVFTAYLSELLGW